MDWNRANATAEAIQRLRDDQRAQVAMSEDAALVEMRAHHAAEQAHAVIERCRQRIADDAEEVAQLRAERA